MIKFFMAAMLIAVSVGCGDTEAIGKVRDDKANNGNSNGNSVEEPVEEPVGDGSSNGDVAFDVISVTELSDGVSILVQIESDHMRCVLYKDDISCVAKECAESF